MKLTTKIAIAILSTTICVHPFVVCNEERVDKISSVIQSESKGRLTEAQCIQVSSILVSVDEHKSVNPVWIMAIIKTESEWHPAVESRDGAVGLMQIKPRTASYVCGGDRVTHKMLKDPVVNVSIGAEYIAELYKMAGTKRGMSTALCAYQQGDSFLRKNPTGKKKVSSEYSRKVERHVRYYRNLGVE